MLLLLELRASKVVLWVVVSRTRQLRSSKRNIPAIAI